MRMLQRVCFLRGSAAAILCLVIVSCTEKAPWKLGFVGGLSGRTADLGTAARNGVELAIEQANSTGGVNSRKVMLVIKDDRQDPEAARQAVTELIADQVVGVIGHLTSSMQMATIDLINDAGVFTISPTSTTEALTGKDDQFFRVVSSAGAYARNLARYVAERPNVATVVTLIDGGNAAYTQNWMDNFTSEFTEQGGTVVAAETFHAGREAPIQEIVDRLIERSPDAVVIAASAMDTALLCQTLRKLNRSIPIYTSEWAGTEQIVQLGGQAVEGIVMSQFFDRDSQRDEFVRFRDAYRARFDEEPGFASVSGYDAARIMLTVLTSAKPGESLKQTALRIRRYDGVQGRIEFTDDGDASREVLLATIKDGKFKVLH